MAGHIFLNEKDDIDWLFSTHLKTYKAMLRKKTKSFELFGNEDAPTKIILHEKKNPHYQSPGFAVVNL